MGFGSFYNKTTREACRRLLLSMKQTDSEMSDEVFFTMKEYWGKSVRSGIAFGKICHYERGYTDIVRWKTEFPQAEIERIDLAVKETVFELQELCEKARVLVGEENAAIFEMQKLIAMDDILINEVKEYILRNSCNAEYALSRSINDYAGRLALLGDETLRAKSADCMDVSRRMLKHMTNAENQEVVWKEPVILLAVDLSPSETIHLDKEHILAIVLKGGSEYSHMAILARSLGIPCVVQAEIPDLSELHNAYAVVDGEEGKLYVEPSADMILKLHNKQEESLKQKRLLHEYIGLPNETMDGKTIQLFVNLENPEDIPQALEQDAGGIGLFRTEFLYLSRNIYPEEEEQFLVYRDVVTGMKGRPVIIRTLDIGADKKLPYLPVVKEDNPAMGMRGIRFCLEQKQLFITQLKALMRAAAYGDVSVLVPMVSAVWEVKAVKDLLEQTKIQLEEEKKAYKIPKLGIMIETPAAVMIADELAECVDFFSIGTNDLTQYILAADRMNPAMGRYTDPYHNAVIRMIEMTVKSGHKAGISVGICGELAFDTVMTETFLRMGVDELSVPPQEVLLLRKKIRNLNLSK